ncbi:hypothetical protein ACHAXT_003232 [Thalassiosira profunda]
MTASATASQVRVGVRVRPLAAKETAEGGSAVVEATALDRTVSLSKRKFTYDSVFHQNVTQSDLYGNVAPPLLSSFLNGYNATILAYGQTGSGKTYTMGSEAAGNFVENERGGGNLRDKDGLIPRFMSDMFTSLFQRKEESEKALLQSRDDNNATEESVSLVDFRVTASFLEVYGEDIYDLLDEDRTPLKIREDSNKEVIVVGLKSAAISNAYEAMNVLNVGTMNRTTGQTLMNLTSSRSHAVFRVNLQQTTRSGEGDDITTLSQFTFVDLAGSERMKKTGAEGERMKEGISINQGLLALGNVINALADDERLAKGEKVHVPYRQSKLTRLLQDALGGNSQTLFLACVSPSDTNASETLSTLHYANRARNIKNAPTRNVDAAAEELRRLRVLSHILRCELISEKFDGVSSANDTRPEVDTANECVNPAEIGRMNEELLQREDVAEYLKRIEEKVSKLSGSDATLPAMSFSAAATFARDNSTPESFLDAVTPLEHTTDEDEDDDGEDLSDEDVNPSEDIQLIDELLEQQQQEEQIDKIDGDIEEQEERLLQLKEHIKVYTDIKEKYELLEEEVQKLESEKQALAEKLEKALSDPSKGCSLSIKTKLDAVKASLQRARQDVRKQQQKCRDAELEAQRCKGLERRIEEMKSNRDGLMRKQKEDAKRQKDFSKTKAREIQILRRQERSAQKKVMKQQMEIQRLKANLERSKARSDKLAGKLKASESNLKQALARKRGNSAPGTRHDEDADADGFAPAGPKVNSMTFVLNKTVSDRVALSQHRRLYASKSADRNALKQSMAREITLLNLQKRQCESMESPPDEVLSAIKEHEENVQEHLISIELAESNLKELRAKHPTIEEDDEAEEANVFEGHEPVLNMVGKLSAPLLRTLLLSSLGSCYRSERGRQSAKENLARKGSALADLQNEIASQNEKISILSKALQEHCHSREKLEAGEKELESSKAQIDACESEKATLMDIIGKSKEALSMYKNELGSAARSLTSATIRQTLVTEVDKTCLTKQLENAQASLDDAERTQARMEVVMTALRHENDKMKKELERTRDDQRTQRPQSVEENGTATPHRPARSKKLDNLKSRYLKKARE